MSQMKSKATNNIGEVSTPSEWRIMIGMELKQMSSDIQDIKSSIKDLSELEKTIQSDVYVLKKEEKRIQNLEYNVNDLQKKNSSLFGQFKIVSAVFSLMLASLFGWMASRQSNADKSIVIKLPHKKQHETLSK